MKHLQQWFHNNSYLVLGLLLVLFAGLFYAIQGVESRRHTDYLDLLRQLKNQDNDYSMELFRIRFQVRSDFDTLLTTERTIHQLLQQLEAPPAYLEPSYKLAIQTLVQQLQGQFEEKQQHTSRFKSAKALYSNSVRYLPLLHDQIEHLKDLYHTPLIDSIYHLTEETLTHVSHQIPNKEGAEKHNFTREIARYRQQLQTDAETDHETKQVLLSLLRHIELIITNLPAVEHHLAEASSPATMDTITHLRNIYLAGYRTLQERVQFATNLLALFTMALFIALLFAIFNLRRAHGDLEQINQDLEARVSRRTEALANAKEYAEKITQSMSEALLVTNPEGSILSCNLAAESLLESDREILLHSPLSQWTPAPIEATDYTGGETTLTLPGERDIPVELSRAILHETDGSIYGYTYVMHDLRERKHAEQQQQFLAFQSGIAEMGVTVMHNIGNIITGITGNIEQARQGQRMVAKTSETFSLFTKQLEDTLGEQITETAPLIQTLKRSKVVVAKSSQLLGAVAKEKLDNPLNEIIHHIQRIGDLIRLHENEVHPSTLQSTFDLKNLVHDVINNTRKLIGEHPIDIEVDVPDTLSQITLPRNQLQQMLTHLMQNSIEAIIQHHHNENGPLNGQIILRADTLKGQSWYLEIEDNGHGIDDQIREEIFNLGFTTKSGRSGYGLHSAGNFVQSTGGSIDLFSGRDETGTRIRITFTQQ